MRPDEELLNHVREQRDNFARGVHAANRDINKLHRVNEELRAEIKRLKYSPKDGPYIQVVGVGPAKEVFLGGHRIEGVMSVDHAVRPDELPQTTLVLHGEYSTTERRKLEVRSPVDFSKHRPDCPLSWQFTAKAEAQYATSRIGDWLDQGWTLEAMREYGFIEPKQ